MESLGTRPTEFVISRSPQMLQLSNQIIWLVAHRHDNHGGRENTVEPKMLCSNNQDARSSCHCLSRICSQFGGSEKSGATFLTPLTSDVAISLPFTANWSC